MKKSRIALKLSLNFAVALLIFSMLIGGMFLVLFKKHTVDLHKNELQTYAESLAGALSGQETHGFKRGMGGYGAYLRFIGEVAKTDVWIVDENLNLMTVSRGQASMNGRYHYTDLPPNASQLIAEVFRGDIVFSEGFSETLSKPTLTVGTPIKNQDGDVWGAVLLHSPVDGTSAALNRGLSILGISILLALAVTSILSMVLSYSFTKPLSKMKATALQLSQGDYAVHCGVTQKDEIGELSEMLDVLADRLQEASQQSEKLESLRREFVANISHELKTPITVMRGSLEALCEKVVTDPQKVNAYHAQMLVEAKFLERLVGDLLDLSRLQNAEFVIELSPVNLCDVLSDVSRSASQLAEKKQIQINTVNAANAGIRIDGDYGRLRQMFLIVLDNAIKFSPEHSLVEINITEQQVVIRDHGPGIDQTQLPYIFDRFYKTRGEENKLGTGLGLAIAKQIADRHKISLTAKNHGGGGAIFIFTLPGWNENQE